MQDMIAVFLNFFFEFRKRAVIGEMNFHGAGLKQRFKRVQNRRFLILETEAAFAVRVNRRGDHDQNPQRQGRKLRRNVGKRLASVCHQAPRQINLGNIRQRSAGMRISRQYPGQIQDFRVMVKQVQDEKLIGIMRGFQNAGKFGMAADISRQHIPHGLQIRMLHAFVLFNLFN